MKNLLNKVTCGDCLEIMKQIPDKSIDLVLTDPPYNIAKAEWDKIDNYIEWCKSWIKECKRVLKKSGSLYVFCSQTYQAEFDLMLRKYFKIENRIIWYYEGGIPAKKHFSYYHEPIFYCRVNEKDYTFNVDDIRIKQKTDRKGNNPKGKNCGDVWYIPNLAGRFLVSTGHPTQKPLKLIKRMMLASSNKGDTVLDPFLGSGTTAVACKELGRNFIGIEISPEYCKIAEQRLAQEVLLV